MRKILVEGKEVCVYDYNEVDVLNSKHFYQSCKDTKNKIWKKVKKKKENKTEISYYLEVPMSFDIETSSFYDNGKKVSIMYIWQFAVDDVVFIGRTWEDYKEFIKLLNEKLNIKGNRKCLIYIHNASHEFQFIRKHFDWLDVFAIDERKILYATTTENNEYRCSYMLSGLSLEHTAKEITSTKIRKLKGDLDYSLIRTPITYISDNELAYCVNDVLIITSYIKEKIKQDGGIENIPLTKTGYVRNYCRNHCLNNKQGKFNKKYFNLMSKLTLEKDEYEMLKNTFMGGFTHGSCLESRNTNKHCDSFDFTSSYPTALISEMYPMSKGRKVRVSTLNQLERYISSYCCMLKIKLYNVTSNRNYEHYISESKCEELSDDAVIDNGRVVSASYLSINITDVDYKIISFMYSYDRGKVEIGDFYIYKKGYLPKEIIECVIKFYEKKTTLKGVKGEEVQYQLFKAMLNAIYGMIVTDIVRDEITYEEGWDKDDADKDGSIDDYNNSRSRFLFYPWGIWCTAYSRYNLFTGISEFGKTGDYLYSDTDSIKVKNAWKHMDYIKAYNKNICSKIERCLKSVGIDKNAYKPKNKKGEEKPLGVWDWETKDGEYEYFKFLGAKRYMYKQNGEWHLTVAGTGKESSMKYMLKMNDTDEDILKAFDDGLIIPGDSTGKLTHSYIDERATGKCVDYNGVEFQYDELSYVHLENCKYEMSMSDKYLKYLLRIRSRTK